MKKNNTSNETVTIFLPKILKPVRDNEMFRIGHVDDGGYNVSLNSIMKSEILISFGLNDDWSFEKHFLELKKIPAYIYDHTVSMRFLTLNSVRKLFKVIIGKMQYRYFVRSFISLLTYNSFFDGKEVNHLRKKIAKEAYDRNVTSLNLILEDIHSDHIFLKVDIEGSEYRVIDQILNNQHRFNAVIIEFHDLDIFWDKFMDFVDEMSKSFVINSININNFAPVSLEGKPHVIEITFSNRNVVKPIIMEFNNKIECVKNNVNGETYVIEFNEN